MDVRRFARRQFASPLPETMALDFIGRGDTLDPRITFSRTSNATLVNSAGAVAYAPHNLLTFSESFDNAAWVKNTATVTANTDVAPDGTTTADLFTATGADSYVGRNSPGIAGGFTYTASIYLRANTPLSLQIFALETAGGTGVQTTVCSVTTQWQRFSVTITTGTAVTALSFQVGGASTFTTGEAVYAWGAQLNVGALQPYYCTTVENALGFTQEFDNAAWTKTNSFVQANLLTFSEQFDNAFWSKARATVSANTTVAPDGTTTADKLVEDTTASNTHLTFSSAVTVTASTVYTYTVYVKASGRDWISMQIGTGIEGYGATVPFAYFNISTGAVGTSSNCTASITAVGNGWYRCILVAVPTTAATTTNMRIKLATGDASESYTGDGTSGVSLWGAQLVQGSTPGDYVRTDSVSRAVGYAAPDGSVTADKLVEDTATAVHSVGQFNPVAGFVYTISVYAKASERSRIQFSGGGFGALGFAAVFDLANGTMAVNTGNKGAISSIGNGWYRCWVTFTASNTVTFAWSPTDNSNNGNYTGNGTSGVFLWGAQISDSASLDPYVYNPAAAFTSTAYYGPRFDYDPATLAARGLLIEEQRTNSIRNSSMVGAVAGTPGTLPTNWAEVGGGIGTLTRQIVGTGTENGIIYVDLKLSGTTSTVSVGYAFEAIGGIAASNAQTWTNSFWCKVVAGSTSNITNVNSLIEERTGAGAFLANTVSAISPTSTLTRFSQTFTLNAGATVGQVRGGFILLFSSGVAIDITLRIGLPQLELGAFATSVIPTTTAAATRAADVATMVGDNFSNWYNQSEGTIYADARTYITYAGVNQFPFLAQVDDGTVNNRIQILARVLSGLADSTYLVTTGGATQASFDTIENDALLTKAVAYKVNDFAFAVGGELETTDTSGTVPVVNRLCIGNQNTATNFLCGHIRRISYYPRRLPDAELQKITV